MKNKILAFWRGNDFFSSVIVFAIFFSLFMFFYSYAFSVVIDDHLFHYKLAKLIRTEGIGTINDFQWIQQTELANEHGRYALTLFNLALIPFTFFDDDITGVKVVDVFWASAFLAIIYYVLRRLKVKYAFLLILLIASSRLFTARIILGRGFVLSLALMMLEVYYFVKGKYKQGFFISLLHVVWHPSTFMMPLAIATIVEVARHLQCQRANVKNIAMAGGAMVLGMAIYPGFPMVFWEMIKGMVLIIHGAGADFSKVEGSEILPQTIFKIGIDFWQFMVALFWGSAIAVYYFVQNKRDRQQAEGDIPYDETLHFVYAFFLLSFSMFGFSIMASARFMDIFIVSAVILFAVSMKKLVEDKKISVDKGAAAYAMTGMLVFLLVLHSSVLKNIKDEKIFSYTSIDPSAVGQAAIWLKERSSKGDTIFLSDWGTFTAAFFYNTHNYYTMGLEPRATHAYNEKLFWKWYNIYINSYYCDKMEDCKDEMNDKMLKMQGDSEAFTRFRDENARNIITSIKNDFNSRLVISTNQKLDSLLQTQKDLIEDSFTANSKESGQKASAFILK